MKFNVKLLLFFLTLIVIGCKKDSKVTKDIEVNRAEEIINTTYEASGSDKLEQSNIQFQFRNRLYRAKRDDGYFKLEREFEDSIRLVRDEYTNNGFERFINNQKVEVPDSMAFRYQESVNSVHYFSVLPYGLKDKAVNANYLKDTTIENQDYHVLEISFDQEGGGQDYEDVFIYWINKKSKLIDYMAYEFQTNGGGIRFREAFNERFINGVRIVDYRNYKPKSMDADLRDLASDFTSGELDLLSTIELKDVTITF